MVAEHDTKKNTLDVLASEGRRREERCIWAGTHFYSYDMLSQTVLGTKHRGDYSEGFLLGGVFEKKNYESYKNESLNF